LSIPEGGRGDTGRGLRDVGRVPLCVKIFYAFSTVAQLVHIVERLVCAGGGSFALFKERRGPVEVAKRVPPGSTVRAAQPDEIIVGGPYRG